MRGRLDGARVPSPRPGNERNHLLRRLADESRRGHLAPGTLGDVTILSGDVTNATADEIRAMEVTATIVDGIVVYCSDSQVCGEN